MLLIDISNNNDNDSFIYRSSGPEASKSSFTTWYKKNEVEEWRRAGRKIDIDTHMTGSIREEWQ